MEKHFKPSLTLIFKKVLSYHQPSAPFSLGKEPPVPTGYEAFFALVFPSHMFIILMKDFK
jgi:hypothetical protein